MTTSLLDNRLFFSSLDCWDSYLSAFIALALLAPGFAPRAFAIDPPPGGGYPSEVTALGEDALLNLTGGEQNTALGFQALYNDTTGGANVAIGDQALFGNTTGGANVGIGSNALLGNTTGNWSVAIGENAMVANTTGGGSVAVGYTALQAHGNGFGNVAVGFGAMSIGLTGSYNTALGNVAMAFSTGSENTAVGDGAMNAASGSENIAIGRSAGINLAGSSNILMGQYAGQNLTRGNNNIEIGNEGLKKDDSVIRIGTIGTQNKTFIAGISGTTIGSGAAVMVNSKGQLGVMTSSERYKDEIQPMGGASKALLALKPVTFRYKQGLDSLGTPQFGLVAEEVAKVDPDLVLRDESGKPYTVRYEAVNAMLLNEFLKEHRKVEALEAKLGALETLVNKQSALINKVSAKVEGTAPRLVSTED